MELENEKKADQCRSSSTAHVHANKGVACCAVGPMDPLLVCADPQAKSGKEGRPLTSQWALRSCPTPATL